MLFNSFQFLLFFILTSVIYFIIKDKWRWLLLLIASYIFYGSWNFFYLSLIILSTFVTYYSGILIEKNPQKSNKKKIVVGSLVINLSILFFFKYYNFVASSFNLILPDSLPYFESILAVVGISFYTFQALSYTMDVYNNKIPAQKHIGKYALFVSFFPQLIAGPIEKASDLLPQFNKTKKFDYERARSGCLLIVWGLFKKVVIADRLGIFVTEVYNNPSGSEGIASILAAIFFAFQLYIDFSAYSEIAVGCARIFGYKLTINFKRPYLSSSFKDFWKRWHITLNSWFFEYLYIPLGGNRSNQYKALRNVIIIFLISGLWHGASWNFVIWGAINSIYLVLFDRLFPQKNKNLFKKIIYGTCIMLLWSLSLIFFRANTFQDALTIYSNLSFTAFEGIYNFGLNRFTFHFTIRLLIFMYVVEIFQELGYTAERIFSKPLLLRWSIYIILSLSILYFGAYGLDSSDSSFIYFQF